MRWIRIGLAVAGGALLLVLLAVGLYIAALYANGRGGPFYAESSMTPKPRSEAARAGEDARQREGRALLARAEAPQILFGDLHVHTNYSADAHLQSLSILDREGRSPPDDACDFARFCSQLDFWSINDHAESLTPEHWQRTIDSVRQCNALAGDPANPDLVSFLGWEWSHANQTDASAHYGHKNVVLRDTEDGRIPTRPIASAPGAPAVFLAIGVVGPLLSDIPWSEWSSFHRYARDVLAVEDCPEDVPVRDLPVSCRESARDPRTLFTKLADWGYPAVVIPHGLAWGVTNPARADLAWQLDQHDPRWQPLLEVYSGHGNSEVYRDFDRPRRDEFGEWICPSGGEDVELCCERASVLARERCEEPGSEACEASVAAAVQAAARIDGLGFWPLLDAVPGSTAADWQECSQLRGSFLPAFDYRPRQSAQYALALGHVKKGPQPAAQGAASPASIGDVKGEATEQRFRLGFIAASDTHRSRPGTGYREFDRQLMTDGVQYPIGGGLLESRHESFYYTGGLAAVHAVARDRGSIFDALQRKQVYGTSGDRMLLWFDLLHPDGTSRPMGSELSLESVPRFEVRALGAFEQQEGCPRFASEALGAERIASLCRGHCYHPSDTRKPIERIEVVRVQSQLRPDEAIRPRVQDPWRSFACPADGRGCTVRFEDPDFADDGRETAYYVRALQAPSPAVNGDPLRCERDEAGRCLRAKPCGERADGLPDDCLAPVAERAWSSPIFVAPLAAAEAR